MKKYIQTLVNRLLGRRVDDFTPINVSPSITLVINAERLENEARRATASAKRYDQSSERCKETAMLASAKARECRAAAARLHTANQ